MKSKYIIRSLAAILLTVMLLPLIISCSDTADVKVKVDNVFKITSLTLPDNFQPNGEINYVNDKIYLQGYVTPNYNTVMYSLKKDGTDGKYIKIPNFGDNSYISRTNITPDGNIVFLCNEYFYDEVTYESRETYYLITTDPDGNEIKRVNATEMFKTSEDDYFYIYNFVFDGSGNMYLTNDRKIFVINSNGDHLFTIEIEAETYINKMATTKNGDVFVIYNSYSNNTNKVVMKKIDFNKKSLGDEFDISGIPERAIYNIITSYDDKFDFFYDDGNSLFGYSIAAGSGVEILNWINSDINNTFSNSYFIMSSDEILCSGFDYIKEKSEVMVLNRVPEEDVKEKYIITLAVFGMGYDMKAYVIDFNRNNLEYRIQIEDYTKYSTNEDYMAGITRLNIDITSGKIPDILLLNNNIPIDSYISKGIFADINKYIDDDPEINRSDYFENILAAAETNGKLYWLFSNFTIQTVVGKEKFFGNMTGWTLKEFNDFMAAQPQETTTFLDMTQMDMLHRYVTMLIDEFVDVDTGKCNFDSEEFIAALEFAKTFPEDYENSYMNPDFDYESFWKDRESSYKEDRTLLMDHYLYDFNYVWDLVKVYFDDDITFIGMPTPNRKGSAFSPSNEFAISAKTKHPDGVWSFLRQFIMDEYFEGNSYGGFPIKRALVEKMAEDALNPPENNGDGGVMPFYNDLRDVPLVEEVAPLADNEVVEETTTIEPASEDTPVVVAAPVEVEYYQYNRNIRYIDGVEVDIGNITPKYTDMVIELIESVDNISRYDEEMINIINEEAQGYFNGQKSAAETAKIIQNRLQNYVDEKR